LADITHILGEAKSEPLMFKASYVIEGTEEEHKHEKEREKEKETDTDIDIDIEPGQEPMRKDIKNGNKEKEIGQSTKIYAYSGILFEMAQNQFINTVILFQDRSFSLTTNNIQENNETIKAEKTTESRHARIRGKSAEATLNNNNNNINNNSSNNNTANIQILKVNKKKKRKYCHKVVKI